MSIFERINIVWFSNGLCLHSRNWFSLNKKGKIVIEFLTPWYEHFEQKYGPNSV